MNKHIESFHLLHKKDRPLFLYNIWDAGTAKILATNGAEAIATSSWSVAEAQGYPDGQSIPFDELLVIVKNIVKAVNLPVTVDFESGYALELKEVCENFSALIDIGVAGVNFEDQNIAQGGIFGIDKQSERITALRKTADKMGVNVFINARTDIFLQEDDQNKHINSLEAVIHRGRAYREAGANGFFIPGTTDPYLIKQVCSAVDLPVNIMDLSSIPDLQAYSKSGVSRVSIGPKSWIEFCGQLKDKAREIYR